MNKLHSHTQSDRGIRTSSYPKQLEHDWTFITLMPHTHTTYMPSYWTVKDCDTRIFTVKSRLFSGCVQPTSWLCWACKDILQLTKDVRSCSLLFKSGSKFCRKIHVNEKFWGIHSSDTRLRSSGLCLVDKDLHIRGTRCLHLYTEDGSSMFLIHVHICLEDYTLSEPRQQSLWKALIFLCDITLC